MWNFENRNKDEQNNLIDDAVIEFNDEIIAGFTVYKLPTHILYQAK